VRGKARVILREKEGVTQEPIELLIIECPVDCQGAVMSLVATRRSELIKMDTKGGTMTMSAWSFIFPHAGCSVSTPGC